MVREALPAFDDAEVFAFDRLSFDAVIALLAALACFVLVGSACSEAVRIVPPEFAFFCAADLAAFSFDFAAADELFPALPANLPCELSFDAVFDLALVVPFVVAIIPVSCL